MFSNIYCYNQNSILTLVEQKRFNRFVEIFKINIITHVSIPIKLILVFSKCTANHGCKPSEIQWNS